MNITAAKLIASVGATISIIGATAATIEVDRDAILGRVKPVNAVGQPPMLGVLDKPEQPLMFHYLKEAGIPYSRLHDVEGWMGGGLYVDIPNVFPNFDADENDPKNYRFEFTDALLVGLEKNGVEPFFRLGVTIENFVYYKGIEKKDGMRRFPRVYSFAPKDHAKWARICEHVMRHYLEGWADGYKMKITYWEIWNEPDNDPRIELHPLYDKPFADYIQLYGVTAKHLKAKFPQVKIGGYGSCGFYAGVGSDHVPAAHTSPRNEYFVECAHQFLAEAKKNGWPLDFFSYHSYSQPNEAMRQIRFADELLNKYDFTADKCERIFNEWLPYVSHDYLGTATQAAGIAAELIGLQNGPCEVACIYDAKCGIGNYAPLFNPMTYKPHKAYYAFTAFNELRKRGMAVKATVSDGKNIWAAAAKGADGKVALMVANDSNDPMPLKLKGISATRCRITDCDRTDVEIAVPTMLPHRSFVIIFE